MKAFSREIDRSCFVFTRGCTIMCKIPSLCTFSDIYLYRITARFWHGYSRVVFQSKQMLFKKLFSADGRIKTHTRLAKKSLQSKCTSSQNLIGVNAISCAMEKLHLNISTPIKGLTLSSALASQVSYADHADWLFAHQLFTSCSCLVYGRHLSQL